jgi:hypothetical protein
MDASGFHKFYRAPLPAILAVTIVFVWQALGHTVMILFERGFGEPLVYPWMIALGFLGVLMVWYGKKREELGATLWGFAGGSLIWTTWIEFSFHYYARVLGVEPLVENGVIVTKQEYLVMPSSVGVLLATLVFFFFNKDSRCNAFRWLHRAFRMNPGEVAPSKDRDISSIVAMETIYVTWFFYVYLLLLYDPAIGGGDRSVAAYVSLGLFVAWSVYLINRLLRFQRVASAMRYAIPTGIIAWCTVEIMGRWSLFTEVWEYPERYGTELTIIGIGLAAAFVLSMLSPARQLPPDREALN